MKLYHVIRPKDRKRIRCDATVGAMTFCNRPALVCEHVHWNTGNTAGVSFFYICGRHAAEPIATTKGT